MTEEQIAERIAALTLDEKLSLIAGRDMWHTHAVERAGIPPLRVTDGPIGARGTRFADGETSACFPCGTALGATWNPSLVEEIGSALAEEVRSKGAHVLLAPTVNIHRTPLAGRNFECYSEDPYLTGRLAVGFIQGIQARGVGACIKHFVCNDSEYERHTISSEVDERTLREIYLLPFEMAVAEAHPWALMSAYNKLNGTWCSEDPRLLTEILRGEWGFDGFVVSDWFGTNSSAPVANAGLDLEMPGPGRHLGPKLASAIESGEVAEGVVDEKVRNLLRAADRVGAFDQPELAPERAEDRPEHRAIARRAAQEAIVLLKNEGGVLPLDRASVRSVAVIGPNAATAVNQGGGSARVSPHYSVSPLEGIRNLAGEGVDVRYELGCTNHKRLPPLDSTWLLPIEGEGERGLRVDYFAGGDSSGEPIFRRASRRADFSWLGEVAPGVDRKHFSARLTGVLRAPESGTFTFSLASAGLSRLLVDGEVVVDNWSQQVRGDSFYGMGSTEVRGEIDLTLGREALIEIEFRKEGKPFGAGLRAGILPPVPEDAIQRAEEAARAADAAVLVVGLNADWESEGHDRKDLSLPGQQVELIERVAAANPRTVVVLNTGAPVEMPWQGRVPGLLQIWYTGQESGNALADLLFGEVSPSGRLPTTFPKRLEDNPTHLHYPGFQGKVPYAEGVFVGYRYYEKKRLEPLFPFGHGLSYADFEYGPLEVAEQGDVVVASLDVTHRGERPAAEVVQCYVCDPEASVARPEKELRAFEKVFFEPGETRRIRFELGSRAFAFYDAENSSWKLEPGEFEILIGRSSANIQVRASWAYASKG